MRHLLIAAMALLPFSAMAQDRAGNDTAGEWKVTHHKPFGLWDSFCDERTTGDALEQRCYVRYVEVFSPRPTFGAMFAFITPDGVEFGMERGIRFINDGLHIKQSDAIVWKETRRPCSRGNDCRLEGDAAKDLLSIMSQGGALIAEFNDRQGNPQRLEWDLSRMDEILADYQAQSKARGLTP